MDVGMGQNVNRRAAVNQRLAVAEWCKNDHK